MEWTGKWITGPAQVDDDEKVPPYLFRKKIEIKREKEIARATLYASALGVYTFRINGNRVGGPLFCAGVHGVFLPGAVSGISGHGDVEGNVRQSDRRQGSRRWDD